jgi:tRNA threonylcarbamoyladenosine dehydratase
VIDLSYENRFGGLTRLFGPPALSVLRQAHVMVVGIGGVGSWAVEALARSGIGVLTLVDLDDVCATNTNRQMHALDPEWGRLKAEVLGERIKKINPEAVVRIKANFFTTRSAGAVLDQLPHVILDAMDSVPDKVSLAVECARRGVPLIISGGAGGKSDPTRLRVADLGRERGDTLLKALKRGLKTRGMEPDSRGFWGLECVYSEEPSVMPWNVCPSVARPQEGGASGIHCAEGFGAAAFATGTFGFCLASRAVFRLLNSGSTSN